MVELLRYFDPQYKLRRNAQHSKLAKAQSLEQVMGGSEALDREDGRRGQEILSSLLDSGDLFSIGRLGAVETSICLALPDTGASSLSWINRKEAWVNAGIWPPTEKNLRKFKALYVESLAACDVLALWPDDVLPRQTELIAILKTTQKTVPLSTLDPVLTSLRHQTNEVWTRNLAGKKVLVVHSMKRSIEAQLQKLSRLHKFDILPDFELRVLEPPQTQGLAFWKKPFKAQLESFSVELDRLLMTYRPDVALVAAGGYGMPISTILRSRSISSIYVGGALQLIFGIMGTRWQSREEFVQAKNSDWLEKPLENPPFGYQLIERGTYW